MKHALVFLALLICLAVGVDIPLATTPAVAQGVTPAPGQHAEVRTAFPFVFKATPTQIGWLGAEYKDEGGRQYYKVDVLSGCGEWQANAAGDSRPGLTLTPGGATCPGFSISFGVLYWFSTPPDLVTPSPVTTPSTATVTPPPNGATAVLPSPSPTLAGSVTSTPSPPGGTPMPTARILYGNMCEPKPTPQYPHSITIYGQGGLNDPAFYWWCQANVTPDLVILVPKSTFEAAYDDGPRKLLESLGR